jgi:hypothetical protein
VLIAQLNLETESYTIRPTGVNGSNYFCHLPLILCQGYTILYPLYHSFPPHFEYFFPGSHDWIENSPYLSYIARVNIQGLSKKTLQFHLRVIT